MQKGWLITFVKVCYGFAQVNLLQDGEHCQVIYKGEIKKYYGVNEQQPIVTVERPAVAPPAYDEMKLESEAKLIEVFGLNEQVVNEHIDKLCSAVKELDSDKVQMRHVIETQTNSTGLDLDDSAIQDVEVRKIIDNGPPSNRIDVVFMGDGYTLSEKSKFFEDIKRLTTEMFEGPTFKSWLPIFNIWAIFAESKESGIGNGVPKQTAFGLYREENQLRAIFPGNAQNARKMCQLTGLNACDYPSLIGNDDYYGGLGGEFVIATRSKQSGTVVLRHEMGHNFAKVGEEYDSGQVYSGVNAVSSVNSGWKHWLSSTPREERAIYRILEYPWHDLKLGPKSFTFKSDGKYSRYLLSISMTGSAPPSTFKVTLDGQTLPVVGRSNDREFYDFSDNRGFSAGSHTITFSGTQSGNSDVPLMLASINLHEFGSPSEFIVDNSHISYYPTWDYRLRKTLRPTNAQCLMRNMTSTTFCPVCKEGIWSQFLKRVSLIDSLTYNSPSLNLKVPELGHLRPTPVPQETMKIDWFLNSVSQPQFNQSLTIRNPAKGSWSVKVKFSSSEIRYDPQKLTEDTASITI